MIFFADVLIFFVQGVMPWVKIYRPWTWTAWRAGCRRTASGHHFWWLENTHIHHIPGHDFNQI